MSHRFFFGGHCCLIRGMRCSGDEDDSGKGFYLGEGFEMGSGLWGMEVMKGSRSSCCYSGMKTWRFE